MNSAARTRMSLARHGSPDGVRIPQCFIERPLCPAQFGSSNAHEVPRSVIALTGGHPQQSLQSRSRPGQDSRAAMSLTGAVNG